MNFLKHLTKYQEGGQDVMGILQQFAQMQGLNQEQFKEMITKFQQLQPEEQQEALQQIQQAMQSSQSQSQGQNQQVDPNMQQEQMMQQQASQMPSEEPMMQQGGFIPFNQYYKDAGLNMYQGGGLNNPSVNDDYPAMNQPVSEPFIPLNTSEINTPVLTPKDVATIAKTYNKGKELQMDLFNQAKQLGLTDSPEFKKFVGSSIYKKSRNTDNPEFDGVVGANTKALADLISKRTGDKDLSKAVNSQFKTTKKFLGNDSVKKPVKDDPMKDPVNSIHSNEYVKYNTPLSDINKMDYKQVGEYIFRDKKTGNLYSYMDNPNSTPTAPKLSNDNNYILQKINEHRSSVNAPYNYGYDDNGNVIRKVGNRNIPISKEEYEYLKRNGFKFN